MIKFQQNQALTSHFESFWSIVKCKQTDIRVGNEVKVTLLDSSVINKPAFVPNSFTFERGTEESCKL